MVDDIRLALKPGTEIDGYRIESVLGVGGFGMTYRATEVMLDRVVAIKEYLPTGFVTRGDDGLKVEPLSPQSADDYVWGLDRFRTEAQTLVAFRHPNIVPVLRYFEAHGTGYLVMEFVEGQTLAQKLHPDRTISEADIHDIIDPLLDGLQAVHEKGFLHRDIKPANIFLRDDGSPVLIDFGAARQALGQYSKSLTAIISEGYAPYEQYDSAGEQGPWTDIYALGGVLYRCVTGKRPPDAPSRVNAIMRRREDPMDPAASLVKQDYSAALLGAIEAGLEIREDDRPQSVGDLRKLFYEAQPKTETDTARDPVADPDETLFAGPAPPTGDSGHVSKDAALPASADLGSPDPPGTQNEPRPAPRQAISDDRREPPAAAVPGKRQRKTFVYGGIAAAVLLVAGIAAVVGIPSGGQSDGQGQQPAKTPARADLNTAPKILWDKTFGGVKDDTAYAFVKHADGGFVAVGETRSKGKGKTDIWVVRIDATGNLLWEKSFGGKEEEYGTGVLVMPDGGLVVVGSTQSKGAGKADIWLLRLDARGNLLWDKTYGGKGADQATSIVLAPKGGFLVAAETASKGAGKSDIWLLKLDPMGNIQWDRTFGGSGYEWPHTIAYLTAGGIAIVGSTDSKGAGAMDVWVLRLEADGKLLWDKTFGQKDSDFGYRVLEMSDGNLTVLATTPSGPTKEDVWLLRLNAGGKLLWSKTFGGKEDDQAFSMAEVSDGGLIIHGQTKSKGAGDWDVWLIRVDAEGKRVWDQTYGGKKADRAAQVIALPDDKVIVFGDTMSKGAGELDFWILQLGYR